MESHFRGIAPSLSQFSVNGCCSDMDLKMLAQIESGDLALSSNVGFVEVVRGLSLIQTKMHLKWQD